MDTVEKQNNGIRLLLSKCERRQWLATNARCSSPDHADPPTSQKLFMLSVEIANDAAVTKDRAQNASPVVIAFISRTLEACRRARNSLTQPSPETSSSSEQAGWSLQQ